MGNLQQEVIRIRIRDRNGMDSALGQAEASLLPQALALGDRGILITRHSQTELTVELHLDVPFGNTYEKRDG